MNIYSFDTASYKGKLYRDLEQYNLFDIFKKNIVNNNNITISAYIVPREFEMRLDRISNYLYGNPNYVEELMVLNDIINPYSVKEGQYIYYCSVSSFDSLYSKDELLDKLNEKRQQLINSSKQNQTTNENKLPVTVKPENLKQIKIGDDNSVQIINKFR